MRRTYDGEYVRPIESFSRTVQCSTPHETICQQYRVKGLHNSINPSLPRSLLPSLMSLNPLNVRTLLLKNPIIYSSTISHFIQMAQLNDFIDCLSVSWTHGSAYEFGKSSISVLLCYFDSGDLGVIISMKVLCNAMHIVERCDRRPRLPSAPINRKYVDNSTEI